MLNLYQDVFKSLNSHNVRYMTIGGIAAILHGTNRVTFDLDLFVPKDLSNAKLMLLALEEANMGTATLISADDLVAHDITVLKDRIRVDILTSIPGPRFEDAWPDRVERQLGDTPIILMGRDALIQSKRAKGRPTDLEDVLALEQFPPA